MNVSELTLLVLRLGFLLILWVFVFVVVYALRADLFGTRAKKLPSSAKTIPAPAPAAHPSPYVSNGAGETELISAPVATATPTSLPDILRPDTSTSPLAGLAHDRSQSPTPLGSAEWATSETARRLVITSGSRAGSEIRLSPEPITIGRSSESGLVIRDDYTSTHHARLMLWNGEWMIQDLDSTNGTFFNGERVNAPTRVILDTPIKIGLTSFELRR